MKYGLTKSEYDFILNTVVTPLSKSNAKVWCFGSRARGDQNKFSDLDLMVESPEDQSLLISEIIEKLEESDFPYKVDLVSLQSFASSYMENFQNEKVPY